jgi:hypothetical protein
MEPTAMFTHTTITSVQSTTLQDALLRIVVSEAVVMSLRVAALQGIEDLEMGSAADKMTIRDVEQYTTEWKAGG